MAKHTNIRLLPIQPNPGIFGKLPLFIEHVTHRNFHPTLPNEYLPRKAAFLILVHVAGHYRDRSNGFELLEDRVLPDIASVENVIDPPKMSSDDRIKQTVSVGNHADANGPTLLHGVATG